MCLTEFNEKIYEKSIRSEGFEQGFEQSFEQGFKQGFEQGGLQILISLVKKGFITTSIASDDLGIAEKDFIILMEAEN